MTEVDFMNQFLSQFSHFTPFFPKQITLLKDLYSTSLMAIRILSHDSQEESKFISQDIVSYHNPLNVINMANSKNLLFNYVVAINV